MQKKEGNSFLGLIATSTMAMKLLKQTNKNNISTKYEQIKMAPLSTVAMILHKQTNQQK